MMSSTTGVLLLSLLGAVLLLAQEGGAYEPIDKRFFMHYSKLKVFSQCFGKERVKSWHRLGEGIIKECKMEEENRPEETVPPAAAPAAGADTADMPADGKSKSPFYSAAKIRFIKNEMLEKIRFVNCTMNKMNITLTPEGKVDYGDLAQYYEGLDLNSTLKVDLDKGLEKCAHESTCMTTKGYGPLDVDFRKKVKFLKCERHCRLVSCVKEDLRKYKDQFEFEGLDGVLDDVEDDVDKMFAITAARVSIIESHLFI